MQIWTETGCVSVDFASREVIHYAPTARLLGGERVLDRARQPGADIDRLKAEIFTEYLRVDGRPFPRRTR